MFVRVLCDFCREMGAPNSKKLLSVLYKQGNVVMWTVLYLGLVRGLDFYGQWLQINWRLVFPSFDDFFIYFTIM